MDWRAQFRINIARLLIRGGLALAVAGAVMLLWALPTFCRVDAYRPQVQAELEKALDRRISLGRLYARLLPVPGVVATDVVLFDPRNPREPQVSVSRIFLTFYFRSLFRFQPHVKTIDLDAPRLIVRRRSREWPMLRQSLAFPAFKPASPGGPGLETLVIRHGQIDFTDETLSPPLRRLVDELSLRYSVSQRRGDLEGQASWLGSGSMIRGHYEADAAAPLRLTLGRVSGRFLFPYFPRAGDWLESSADIGVSAHRTVSGGSLDSLSIVLEHANLKRLPGVPLSGHIRLGQDGIGMDLTTEKLSPPMHIRVDSPWPSLFYEIKVRLQGCSPPVARALNFPRWLAAPEGAGQLAGTLQVRPGEMPTLWTLRGGNFGLEGSALHLDDIVCRRTDAASRVHLTARHGKSAWKVEWAMAAGQTAQALSVRVAASTVREILEVFRLQHSGAETPGYETVLVDELSFAGRILPGQRLDIRPSVARIAKGLITLQGDVDLSKRPSLAHFNGIARALPIAPYAPPGISKRALQAARFKTGRFDVRFPFRPDWARAMEGDIGGRLAMPWTVDANWLRKPGAPAASWSVVAESLTVGDVLRLFALERPNRAIVTGHLWKPAGYEDLQLRRVQMAGRTGESLLKIARSHLEVEGGSLEFDGAVDLSTRPARGNFHGVLRRVPVDRVLGRLMNGRPVLSGTGQSNFDLQFPFSREWIAGLRGRASVRLEDGVLFALKNLYRVLSFTNLTNYLTFGGPDLSAKGVPFERLDGVIASEKGVLKTDDLFLVSPDMKMAAEGTLDLPRWQIHAVVKFQIFRFLENIVTSIPGLHTIFQNGRKIVLPVPVRLDGPLDNIQIS